MCRRCDSPWSYLRVPLTRRAAAFMTRCSLSVTDLGAPANTVLQKSTRVMTKEWTIVFMDSSCRPRIQMLSGKIQYLATVPAQLTVMWHSCGTDVDHMTPCCSLPCSNRAAAIQPTRCMHTLWLSDWLTDNTVLSVFNVDAIYYRWQLWCPVEWHFQRHLESRPKAKLALDSWVLMSSSTTASEERMVPRYQNLSSAQMVMSPVLVTGCAAAEWPAGWNTTSVFFRLTASPKQTELQHGNGQTVQYSSAQTATFSICYGQISIRQPSCILSLWSSCQLCNQTAWWATCLVEGLTAATDRVCRDYLYDYPPATREMSQVSPD